MNKKSWLIIFILIAGLVFTSCSKNDTAESMAYDMGSPQIQTEYAMEDGDIYYGDDEAANKTSSVNAGDAVDYSEKIIYNVNMGIVVDDPVETSKMIKEQVSALGGYVSSSYSNKYDDNSSYVNMEVRVPSKGLNDMTDYIYSISEVEYENLYTDNITESYYDTVTRLEHEKVQAAQLEELMTKAETIEDIIKVRQELSNVQQNIEVYEGRIRMWDSLVDYSTINISISPTPTIDADGNKIRLITLGETGRGITRAFNNSLIFIANFFSFLVRLVAALIIPAVIVVPIVIIIVKLSKKGKAKTATKKQDQ